MKVVGWNKPVAQVCKGLTSNILLTAIFSVPGIRTGQVIACSNSTTSAMVSGIFGERDTDFMELMDIVAERIHELDLYFWHAGGKTSDGDPTNCFHSLTRQLLAQDPLVYALVVSLWSDGVHKLNSYPLAGQRR